jgi:hypothetical protein
VRCHGLVVGPQRHCEAIARVHTRVRPRLQGTHRASDLGEPLSELDFELCNLSSHRGDPGKDAAWRQPQCQLVRVVENNRVVGRQVERCSDRSRSRDRTRDVGHLHRRILTWMSEGGAKQRDSAQPAPTLTGWHGPTVIANGRLSLRVTRWCDQQQQSASPDPVFPSVHSSLAEASGIALAPPSPRTGCAAAMNFRSASVSSVRRLASPLQEVLAS